MINQEPNKLINKNQEMIEVITGKIKSKMLAQSHSQAQLSNSAEPLSIKDQALLEILKDYMTYLTRYDHPLRTSDDYETLKLHNEDYFVFEVDLDSDDKYTIHSEPNLHSSMYDLVKNSLSEVKYKLMNNKLSNKETTMAEFIEITQTSINDTITDNVIDEKYWYPPMSLERHAQYYLSSLYDDLENATDELSKAKLDLLNNKDWLDDSPDFIDVFSDLSGVSSEISIDYSEIINAYLVAPIEGTIVVATPEEINSDCSNLQNMLKFCELGNILGDLSNFEGSTDEERLRNRNNAVQDLLDNYEVLDNGLTHLLIQNGLTFDVIADYNQYQQALKNPATDYFVRDLIREHNESFSHMSLLTIPVSMTLQEAVTLNVMNALSNASNPHVNYHHLFKEEWRPMTWERLDDERKTLVYTPQKMSLHCDGERHEFIPDDVIDAIPNEIHGFSLAIQAKESGLYDPTNGGDGLFMMEGLNYNVPLSSIIVQSDLNGNVLGSYPPELNSDNLTKINVLNAEGNGFTNMIQFNTDAPKVNVAQQFLNGVDDVALEAILEKNIESINHNNPSINL